MIGRRRLMLVVALMAVALALVAIPASASAAFGVNFNVKGFDGPNERVKNFRFHGLRYFCESGDTYVDPGFIGTMRTDSRGRFDGRRRGTFGPRDNRFLLLVEGDINHRRETVRGAVGGRDLHTDGDKCFAFKRFFVRLR